MKKSILVLLVLILAFLFAACSEEDIINNPVYSTKGIYVLYEGLFNQPATYDYGFIDKDLDTVFSNVYQNSNNGANLNAVPDGMVLLGSQLYVMAQGNFGQQGTIYRINSENNQLIASRNFGTNPYELSIADNYIYATNTASSYVSKMDLNLTPVNDSIQVGPAPSEIVSLNGYSFIAKQSYTFENSLSILNNSNSQVSKIFFNAPPVSVAKGSDIVYVSTYFNKKIYYVSATSLSVTDSAAIGISEPAIGLIVTGDSRTLFILGVADTSFAYNIGKSVYKFDVVTKSLVPGFNIQFTGSNDAYGIAYDATEDRLYVANSKSGTANGELRVYDDNGNLVKTFADIGGKFPKKMVFKY